MTDTTTLQRIRVLTSKSGPYIKLPYAQVDYVRKILDDNRIRFWVDHMSISHDGKPYETYLWIARDTDPLHVQTLLDTLN